MKIEYGRQADCTAEGCNPRHSDDRFTIWWDERHQGPPPLHVTPKINNHAYRWVQREITEWHDLVDPQDVI